MVKKFYVLVLPYLVCRLDLENKSAHQKAEFIPRRLDFKATRPSSQYLSVVIWRPLHKNQ